MEFIFSRLCGFYHCMKDPLGAFEFILLQAFLYVFDSAVHYFYLFFLEVFMASRTRFIALVGKLLEDDPNFY